MVLEQVTVAFQEIESDAVLATYFISDYLGTLHIGGAAG